MTRIIVWALLGSAPLFLTGCLDSVLGVLLAPESVIADAANQAVQSGAQTLTGASIDDLSNTAQAAQDIDRILKNNPDDQSADRLRALRDKLTQHDNQPGSANATPGLPTATPVTTGTAHQAVDSRFDKAKRRRADRLTVVPPGDRIWAVHKPTSHPETIPDVTSLRRPQDSAYTLSVQPVRLKNPDR